MKYAIKSLAGFAALALAVPTGSAAVNTYTFGLHTGIFSVNLDPDAYYDDAAPCPGTTFPLAVNGAEWGTGTLTIYSDPSTPWWQVYVFGCSGQNLDSASAYLPAHAGPWTGQEIVDALDAVPWHTGVWLISATAGPGGSAAVSTYTFGLQAGTFSVNLGPEAYYDAGPDPDGFVFPLSVNGSGWATGTLTIYSHPSTPWWGVQVLDSSGDGVAAASAYLPAHAGPWTGREIVDAVAEVSGHTGVCFISVTPVCQPKHAPICQGFAPAEAVAEATPNVVLDGTASFDPDNDPIVCYRWSQVSGPQAITITGAETALATFDAPIIGGSGGNTAVSETYVFSLTVSDGQLASTCEVTVLVENVNHCPVAMPGLSVVASEGTVVVLDGSSSTDPDSDTLRYTWVQTDGPSVVLEGAETPLVQFVSPFVGQGGADLVFELTVDDESGCTDEQTVTVHVDNLGDPPSCAAARASVAQLWPPNHKFVPVMIENVGTGGLPTEITVTSVRQDEPAEGLGDGDAPCDAVVAIEPGQVLLRAERAGMGNGRMYHVFFTASNAQGTCEGEVTVNVPADMKPGRACVDEGPIFPSCE